MIQKSQPYAWHVVRNPVNQKGKGQNRGVEVREGNFIKFGRMCFWIREAKVDLDGLDASQAIPSVDTNQDDEGEIVVEDMPEAAEPVQSYHEPSSNENRFAKIKPISDSEKSSDKDRLEPIPYVNKSCRICLDEGNEFDEKNPLISPCKCAGTMRYIHAECLTTWLNT